MRAVTGYSQIGIVSADQSSRPLPSMTAWEACQASESNVMICSESAAFARIESTAQPQALELPNLAWTVPAGCDRKRGTKKLAVNWRVRRSNRRSESDVRR